MQSAPTFTMAKLLLGKIVVVTGSSQGIGKATAIGASLQNSQLTSQRVRKTGRISSSTILVIRPRQTPKPSRAMWKR
jgi:putative ribosome biogenesis GTPase RsgA